MALPSSGTITLNQIKAEFGRGNNLRDYLGAGGAPSSGNLKITDFYGRSSWSGITVKCTTKEHAYNDASSYVYTHGANRMVYSDSLNKTAYANPSKSSDTDGSVEDTGGLWDFTGRTGTLTQGVYSTKRNSPGGTSYYTDWVGEPLGSSHFPDTEQPMVFSTDTAGSNAVIVPFRRGMPPGVIPGDNAMFYYYDAAGGSNSSGYPTTALPFFTKYGDPVTWLHSGTFYGRLV